MARKAIQHMEDEQIEAEMHKRRSTGLLLTFILALGMSGVLAGADLSLGSGFGSGAGTGNRAAGSEQASGAMTAPTLGLVADSKGMSIHAVVGVPSAASLSDSLPLPVSPFLDRTGVWVAPGGARGLIGTAEGWAAIDFPAGLDGAAGQQNIEGTTGTTPGNLDQVFFSPSGSAAAIVSGGSVQVILLNAGARQVIWSAALPSEWTALAINDGGSLLAVASGAAVDGGAVDLFARGSSAQRVYSGQGSALAFLPGESGLAVLDTATGVLSLLDGLTGNPASRVVAASEQFIGRGMLLTASGDGEQLFLAQADGTVAYRVGIADGAIAACELPAPVQRLDRLGSGDAFVFSFERGQPAWLLWDDGGTLRAVFAAGPETDEPTRRSRRR